MPPEFCSVKFMVVAVAPTCVPLIASLVPVRLVGWLGRIVCQDENGTSCTSGGWPLPLPLPWLHAAASTATDTCKIRRKIRSTSAISPPEDTAVRLYLLQGSS